MINLKTKFEKHVKDNEKRRKSIKEKEKAKSNQSLIIKQALSNRTLSNNYTKKVIFNDDNEDDPNIALENSNNKSLKKKSVLFDNSDSETEDFEIKEKSGFDGEKGFELLNLQSTYGNDERFKIDERFLEGEKEKLSEENHETSDISAAGEKAEQLKILENILGTYVVGYKKDKKEKKRINEMVRYDSSNKNHEIYELSTQSDTAKPIPSEKIGKERKKTKTLKNELPKVSKKKFYDISSDIKNCFKGKKENGQFSLLQTYGLNDLEKNDESQEVEKKDRSFNYVSKNKKNYELKKEPRMAKEKLKAENEVAVNELKVQNSTLARGIWKESFFFSLNDPRFKEGLEFINKKNSKEARDADENYDKTRKKIKEILRLHLKKHICKNDPFRNQIGGMNKKQLAGSKIKYSKINSNKRKLLKQNIGRSF